MRESIVSRALGRLRGAILRRKILARGGTCGNGLKVGPRVQFKYAFTSGLRIGSDVQIGSDVVFHVDAPAHLVIGDRVKITGYSFISAAASVRIGDDCQIAEFVSIRDADHGIARRQPIASQPLRTTPISIGNDCWIARGVALLRGTELGNGCVVAANAVVKGAFAPGRILAGVPARELKER